jgi:hypothetical protein
LASVWKKWFPTLHTDISNRIDVCHKHIKKLMIFVEMREGVGENLELLTNLIDRH